MQINTSNLSAVASQLTESNRSKNTSNALSVDESTPHILLQSPLSLDDNTTQDIDQAKISHLRDLIQKGDFQIDHEMIAKALLS